MVTGCDTQMAQRTVNDIMNKQTNGPENLLQT